MPRKSYIAVQTAGSRTFDWKFLCTMVAVGILTLVLVIDRAPVDGAFERESSSSSTPTAYLERASAELTMQPPALASPRALSGKSPLDQYEHAPRESKPEPAGGVPRMSQIRSMPKPASRTMIRLRSSLLGLGENSSRPIEVREISELLRVLIAQGAEALPVIEEFLQSGQDLSFAELFAEEDLFDYASLRLALFDVLFRTGGTEAVGILYSELQATADPVEIAALGNLLEALAPDQYRYQIVEAALETLVQASQDPPAAGDLGGLFQMLHDYGDVTVIPELQRYLGLWEHYATFALARVAEGEGIPVLIDMVEDRVETSTNLLMDRKVFALQMLAQVAFRDPNAHHALVEQALLNRIPESMWARIALTLAGDYQFQLRKPLHSRSADVTIGENHPDSAQILYLTRGGVSTLSLQEKHDRLALVNELLSVSESPQAVFALESVHTLLTQSRL